MVRRLLPALMVVVAVAGCTASPGAASPPLSTLRAELHGYVDRAIAAAGPDAVVVIESVDGRFGGCDAGAAELGSALRFYGDPGLHGRMMAALDGDTVWTEGALTLRLEEVSPGAVTTTAHTSCGKVDVTPGSAGWVRAGSGDLGAAYTALGVEGFNGRTWTMDCPGGGTMTTAAAYGRGGATGSLPGEVVLESPTLSVRRAGDVSTVVRRGTLAEVSVTAVASSCTGR
jgi:hypothetical protein